MNRVMLLCVSGLIGIAGGFGLRALRQPPAPGPDDFGKLGKTVSGSFVRTNNPGPQTVSERMAQLQEDLSLSDDVTRWLRWMTAVEQADPGDYPALARLARELPGALNILGARWIDRDPQGLLEACQKPIAGFPADELASLLFETWPKTDPDAVLAVLKAHPDLQRGWQYSALNNLFKTHPEQALMTMSALRIESYGPDMVGVKKWAEGDPLHAARVALAHPCGFATRRVLETIGKAWADSDPRGALAFATAHTAGSGHELANHILRHWVEKNLVKASDWFAATDESSRQRLLPAFIEAWGTSDATQALHWCLSHTTGRQQTEVVQSLVKGTLAKNPDDAAAMVVGMEVSTLRNQAAVTFAEAMLQKGWWPGLVDSKPGAKAKPEAITWLLQLEPEARRQVITRIGRSWSERDPRGFAAFLGTPAGADSPPEVIAAAATALVRQQPQEALEWAGQTPEPIRQRTLADTFQNWTRTQPDAAMTWLDALPSSDTRREAFYLGAVEHAIPPSAFQSGPVITLEPIHLARKELARLLAADPAAARDRIEALPLSRQERSRILGDLRLNR